MPQENSIETPAQLHKKTLIIGATTRPDRYAYVAAQRLTEAGFPIVPVGIKRGEVFDQPILDIYSRPSIPDVNTVTLYIGPKHLEEHFDYILSLAPKRIIFNPGTEHEELMQRAGEEGVEVVVACTLVMVGLGTY